MKTEQPLSEAGEVVVDPGFVGAWMVSDPVFGEDASHGIRVSLVEEKNYKIESLDKNTDVVEGKLIKIADTIYFEIQSVDLKEEPSDECRFIPGFFHFERRGDWIALRAPDSQAIGKYVSAATEINGTSEGSYPFGVVTISSNPETLAKFLSKHDDEVLGRGQFYRRIID